MAQLQCQRHVGVGFVGGVSEHNSLVASALLFFRSAVYPLVNVGRLLVDGAEYAARVGFKHVLRLGVANAANHIASDFTRVDVGARLDFTRQHHLTSGNKGFAGNFRIGVKGEKVVDKGVRNLVGNFVGMSFRNGLRGK